MKSVIIAGGSGTIGMSLSKFLEKQGYKTLILTRNHKLVSSLENHIHWNIEQQKIDNRISEANFIINLAGAGIADGRWTKTRKRLILNSRIDSTRLLVSTLKEKKLKIDGFINASAIGYYGNGGDQLLNEATGIVTEEFLSDVCNQWENEAKKADSYCDLLSILRIGTVLSQTGGALEKMDKSIPLGIASYLGNGRQFMSWIHIDDLCGIIAHIMENKLVGTYNAVAPEVVTNKKFTDILRRRINKKALLVGTPSLALKIALGTMSKVVLNSSNVDSSKIVQSGYRFLHPTLNGAISSLYPK